MPAELNPWVKMPSLRVVFVLPLVIVTGVPRTFAPVTLTAPPLPPPEPDPPSERLTGGLLWVPFVLVVPLLSPLLAVDVADPPLPPPPPTDCAKIAAASLPPVISVLL